MYLMHWPVPFVPVPFENDPRYSDGRGLADSYEPDQCTKVIGKDWSETHWDKTGEFPPHLLTGVTIHDTWRAMIVCKEAGLCKNIGVCNFNVQLLHELCIGNPTHLPAILQCESHPYCQQANLVKYCQRMGIQFQVRYFKFLFFKLIGQGLIFREQFLVSFCSTINYFTNINRGSLLLAMVSSAGTRKLPQ